MQSKTVSYFSSYLLIWSDVLQYALPEPGTPCHRDADRSSAVVFLV